MIADLSLIKFYFSSDLKTMDKEEAKRKVIEKGGIVREDISSDLWYLVTNDTKDETKIFNKARKLGVTFIDEIEFLKMLE
ncbi:MAG: BRCT domain-containing protein [Promethearchaeota archaeon]